MKVILKIVSKIILVIIIALSISIYFAIVFSPDSKNIKTEFQSIPKDSLDMVIFGSSHTQYGINPAVIYSDSGYYAYVNGSPCQPMEVSYQMLRETLKTQKPKVVLVDVFTMLPAQSVCHANFIYKAAADHMSGMEKINTILSVPDKKTAFDYLFPIRMYHQRWTEIENKDFVVENKDVNYDNFGYINLPPKEYVFKYLESKQKDKSYVLKYKDIKALDDIKKLCDKNGIDLLLIKTPFDIDQENYDTLMEVWNYARKHNIKYVDLIEASKEMDFAFGLDSETWHNTNFGAYKNSKYLSKYLKDNYKFDHKKNEEIEENMSKLSSSTLFSLLFNVSDPYKVLQYASEYDCTMILKYNGYLKTSIKKYENELLNSVGFKNDFINNRNVNYYAVVKNGQLINSDDKQLDVNVGGKNIVVDKKGISINNETMDNTDGELTLVVYANDFSWHVEMSIDYSTKWFWKKGCDGWVCK